MRRGRNAGGFVSLFFARTVWAVHLLILVWLAVVWSLPWKWAWWAAMIGNPVVQLNWWLFDNRCALSILEERLRARSAPSAQSDVDGEPGDFVSRVMSDALGRPVSRAWG